MFFFLAFAENLFSAAVSCFELDLRSWRLDLRSRRSEGSLASSLEEVEAAAEADILGFGE